MQKYTPDSQEDVETLILILLGSSKKKNLSLLHIQKELFLLRDAADYIRPLLDFAAHYKGPYSRLVSDSIRNPMFLDDMWFVMPGDDLGGEFVSLTKSGREKYTQMVNHIRSAGDSRLIGILSALKALHDLYDALSSEELLYVVYTSPKYREYVEKSIVYDRVVTQETKDNLRRKLLVTMDR